MNGIISSKESRNSHSFKHLTTSIAGGVCLFFGFALGSDVIPAPPISNHGLNYQTVDFSKIAWFSSEISEKKFQTKENNSPELSVNLDFVPYTLPIEKKKKFSRHLVQRKPALSVTMVQASRAPENKANSEQHKQNFQDEMTALRTQFFTALYLKPILNKVIKPTEPSTKREQVVPVKVAVKPIVVVPAHSIVRVIPAPAKKVPAMVGRVIASAPAVQPKFAATIVHVIPKDVPREKVAPAKVVEVPKQPTPKAEVIAAVAPQPPITQQQIVAPRASAPELFSITNSRLNTHREEQKMDTQSAELSDNEKLILKEALLDQQLKNIVVPQSVPSAVLASNQNIPTTAPAVIPPPAPTQKIIPPAPVEQPLVETKVAVQEKKTATTLLKNEAQCDILNSHTFMRPGAIGDIQICPDSKEWISNEEIGMNKEKGWVRFGWNDNFPILTRHPAPNGGATLLLDQNAIAIMALKAGIRIAKGAGIVTGVAPDGYKINFSGRAEEAQYFEVNGKRYFTILNAEPGAGVLEVVAEKNQNNGSTLFLPVLPDTITYLDIAAPEQKHILVQVVKSGKTKDAEVSGLTVSISTHRGLQAITQTQGHAALRNVNIIPGFPVFIDVSSKRGEEQSFTYRYELKHKNQFGVYVVNQVSENSIARWVKQIPQGLSDQSAMILGYVDRHALNGFKNSYFAKAQPLTEKYGLEPINFSVLWDGKISGTEPLEGDKPRFMSVQVPEGITQIKLVNESHQAIYSNVIPVSPRVINVISE